MSECHCSFIAQVFSVMIQRSCLKCFIRNSKNRELFGLEQSDVWVHIGISDFWCLCKFDHSLRLMYSSHQRRFQESPFGLSLNWLLSRKNISATDLIEVFERSHCLLNSIGSSPSGLPSASPSLLCTESSLPEPSTCEDPTPHNRQENVAGSVFTFLYFLQDKACVCLCKILTQRWSSVRWDCAGTRVYTVTHRGPYKLLWLPTGTCKLF